MDTLFTVFACLSHLLAGNIEGFDPLFVNAVKSHLLPGDQLNYHCYWTMISSINVIHMPKDNQNNIFS